MLEPCSAMIVEAASTRLLMKPDLGLKEGIFIFFTLYLLLNSAL